MLAIHLAMVANVVAVVFWIYVWKKIGYVFNKEGLTALFMIALSGLSFGVLLEEEILWGFR